MTAAATRPTDPSDPLGVKLYPPTSSKPVWRVAFYDPARQDRTRVFRSFRDKDEALAEYARTVDYVAMALLWQPDTDDAKQLRNSRRWVDDLMDSLEEQWVTDDVTVNYMRGRRGLYDNWIRPSLGKKTVVVWARTPKLSTDILADVGVKRSAATAKNVHGLLVSLVAHAHALGWLDERVNPMRHLRRRRRRAGAPRYVDRSEMPTLGMADDLADAFEDLDKREGWGTPWLGLQCRIAGRCGLRFAEQVALTPQSVQESAQWLQVSHAWTFISGQGPRLKAPKNNKERRVPVPASLREHLAARADGVTRTVGPHGLLFPGRADPLLPPSDSALRRYFVLAARQAGWAMSGDELTPTGLLRGGKPTIPYRNLRHHAAWWMRERAPCEWADVSRYLGHHSVAFTLAIYIRPGAGADARNLTLLEEL